MNKKGREYVRSVIVKANPLLSPSGVDDMTDIYCRYWDILLLEAVANMPLTMEDLQKNGMIITPPKDD